MRSVTFFGLVVFSLTTDLLVHRATADTFGSGVNSFDIEFVRIGNPGNPEDSTVFLNPAGSVAYRYRIGKHEISEQMIDNANALGGLGITTDTRGPNKPATSVSWFEAAQFVNWLNTSAGTTAAYKFDAGGDFQLWQPSDPGYNAANLFRNSQAKYFLPSVDEWYKAAYYDPVVGVYYDYATGSDGPPTAVASGTAAGTAVYNQAVAAGPADVMQVGGLSPYGTLGQGGNVNEWQETAIDLVNNESAELRSQRGAAWGALAFSLSSSARGGQFPSSELNGVGFRIASVVPEPSTAALLLSMASFGVLANRRRH